jgi:hypothetical protein
MTTPHITITHSHILEAMATIDYASAVCSATLCNKAIEIALAEQSAEQYITAEQAEKLVKAGGQVVKRIDRFAEGKPIVYRVTKQAQPEPVATIKLDGNMVTPEQAAAEWAAKKETHELWYRSDRVDWCIWRLKQWNKVEDHNEQYELRPKQPTWTGSRDDVIALLICLKSWV